jgi:hypothetical protein
VVGDIGGFWKYGSEAVANLLDQLFIRKFDMGIYRLPSIAWAAGRAEDDFEDQLSSTSSQWVHTDCHLNFEMEEQQISQEMFSERQPHQVLEERDHLKSWT